MLSSFLLLSLGSLKLEVARVNDSSKSLEVLDLIDSAKVFVDLRAYRLGDYEIIGFATASGDYTVIATIGGSATSAATTVTGHRHSITSSQVRRPQTDVGLAISTEQDTLANPWSASQPVDGEEESREERSEKDSTRKNPLH